MYDTLHLYMYSIQLTRALGQRNLIRKFIFIQMDQLVFFLLIFDFARRV